MKKSLNFVKIFETLKHRVNLGRTGTWNWNFFKIFFEIVKVFGEKRENF